MDIQGISDALFVNYMDLLIFLSLSRIWIYIWAICCSCHLFIFLLNFLFQKRGLPHAHIIFWVSNETSQSSMEDKLPLMEMGLFSIDEEILVD
ncbi:hypothetical protein ACJX0J_029846, partial [Zea mays]